MTDWMKPARLALAGAALSGCASTHSLTPLALEFTPAIREERATGFSAFQYTTFAVFPMGAVNASGGLKEEKWGRSALYAVRNMLEAYGYKFVYVTESPDFLVGIDVDEPVRDAAKNKLYVEAMAVSPAGLVPVAPESAAALAALDLYAWGMPQPSAPGFAPLPGWPPPGGKTSPPPGYWLSRVRAVALDGKSMAPVWAAAGTGVSRTGDRRVHAQLVLWSVLRQLPAAGYTEMGATGDVGGIALEVITPDGENFYPAVRDVADQTTAWKAGVMPNDIILAIGGDPTWGKPWREVRAALQGPRDSEVALTLWRNGRQVNVIAKREPPVAVESAAAAPRPKQQHWKLSRTQFGLVLAGR